MAGNSGMGKMHLDLYTNNAALTQKARFWCNFVSSLKGEYVRKLRILLRMSIAFLIRHQGFRNSYCRS